MAYEERGERQMHQGDWTCSSCQNPINELPFKPDESRLDQLLCNNCHRSRRQNARSDRQMYQGDWVCSNCGNAINELPFQPDQARLGELKCRDCHKASRPARY